MPPVGGEQPGTQPMQPVQPVEMGMPMQPAGMGTPVQPVGMGTPAQPAGVGMPMVQQVQVMPEQKKDIAGLVKTIVIIALSLVAVTFIGLFIWMTVQYNDARDNIDAEVATAVQIAKDEQTTKLEAEFLEREKYPYKTFAGPVDYGQLTFEYPRTWSVYVAAAATSGGDFNAYFNPIQVDAVGKETINALRVTILNKSFDDVTATYQKAVEKKDSGLVMEATTIGADNDIAANRYTGALPDAKGLTGYIVTFKIRDKTAILQTDSVLFEEDFNKLLGTVTFNK